MINRVLIRIKVVQMLYSYLLTQSDFRIAQLPERPSRDRRFAQSVYEALLLLTIELAGYNAKGADGKALFATPNKYFHSSPMMQALAANQEIGLLVARGDSGVEAFDSVANELLSKITASGAYRSYIRKRARTIDDDIEFWTLVINEILEPSAEVEGAARKLEGFSLVGYHHGIKLLVETLQGYADTKRRLSDARRDLQRSLDKAYDLYHMLLWLPVALTRLQEERLDNARNKYLPTAEDLNPNVRLLGSPLVATIADDPAMAAWIEGHGQPWTASTEDTFMLNTMLDELLASEVYRRYLDEKVVTPEVDANFWRAAFKNVILPGDALAQNLESKSVFWNDDLDITGTFVMKTIRAYSRTSDGNGAKSVLLPQFKDEEDSRFGAELFMDAVNNRQEYRSYINRFIDSEHWDNDRLAFMDIVVMIAALAEILNFPSVPVAVSLNEYIEIANSYSTPQSGRFINGILGGIIPALRAEGKLNK